MGWGSWVARIGGYVAAPFTGGLSIPIGEAIAQGIGSHDAIDKANTQQQAGTDKAIAAINRGTNLAIPQLQNAQRVAGDVYNQQRADTQNLFGGAYGTLGGMLGVNVAPIGPAALGPTGPVDPSQGGTLAAMGTAPDAPGAPTGYLGRVSQRLQNAANRQPIDAPEGFVLPPVTAPNAFTRATSHRTIPMRLPDGSVIKVSPQDLLAQRAQQGGQ